MANDRKNTILLTVIGIATLLVAIVGATFAYFTATVTSDETASTIVVRSASGGTSTFVGADIITVTNIYPKGDGTSASDAWVTKYFTIAYSNTNAVNAYTYDLTLNYTNDFGAGELTYALTGVTEYCSDMQTYGTTANHAACTATWETGVTAGSVTGGTTSGTLDHGNRLTIALGTQNIPAATARSGVTYGYLLTISYPNQEYNQNYTAGNSTVTDNPNQGAVLTAWVSAQESTYPSTTANS